VLFWNLGTEVKVGETAKLDPRTLNAYIHISQVALGEAKKEKANEPVVLYVKVGGGQKIVLGTLKRDDIPHLSLDLVLDDESELSHSSKTASVFFCGYKVLTYPYIILLIVYCILVFFRESSACNFKF